MPFDSFSSLWSRIVLEEGIVDFHLAGLKEEK
jgi:hypothetical protein